MTFRLYYSKSKRTGGKDVKRFCLCGGRHSQQIAIIFNDFSFTSELTLMTEPFFLGVYKKTWNIYNLFFNWLGLPLTDLLIADRASKQSANLTSTKNHLGAGDLWRAPNRFIFWVVFAKRNAPSKGQLEICGSTFKTPLGV